MAGAALLWLCAGWVSPAAAETTPEAFYDAVAGAYAPYREAVHYLETGNAGLAALALDRADAEWRKVRARFADDPPKPYAGDLKWKATLAAIGDALEAGLKAADAGDDKVALATLAAVRRDLAELRLRSGQRVYSDCIDAMNAAMDRLWAFRAHPPDRTQPGSLPAFKAAVASTQRWYRRCRDEAPPALAASDEFKRLFAGALAGLDRLDAAASGPADRIVSILRELRSYDKLIWLRFG
ncbi:MAG: hypothetical protein KIT16_14430 [Rhodospirillaceae bacterium]|nr:hypothetical protein [Rhodospirillaceae bacterium]